MATPGPIGIRLYGTQRIALRKLLILDAAEVLGDLRVPRAIESRS
jgi:hypothetical protein